MDQLSTLLRVCRGTSCSSLGGGIHLVRDIEELCGPDANVEPRRCLGRCGSGPNVEVAKKGQASVYVSGARSYEDLEAVIKTHVDGHVRLDDLQKRIARAKFTLRRSTDAQARQKSLESSFALLQGVDDRPQLLAELLVLRVREAIPRGGWDLNGGTQLALPKEKACAAEADARRAVELVPNFAQAHLALADILEVQGNEAAAAESLTEVLRIDRGLGSDRTTMARHLRKLRGETAIQSVEFNDWRVESIEQHTHNAIGFKLAGSAFQTSPHMMPNGDIWHVDISATLHTHAKSSDSSNSTADVVRSYTPVSSKDEFNQGHLRLIVKIYPDGILTQHLATLRVGDVLRVSQPLETLDTSGYAGGVVVVAGGTSVTVALQIAEALLRRYPKRGLVRIVLCNHSTKDLLCLDLIRNLLSKYPTLQVVHCISDGVLSKTFPKGSGTWMAGRISESVLSGFEPHLKTVVSGPPGFCQAVGAMLCRLDRRPGSNFVVLDDDSFGTTANADPWTTAATAADTHVDNRAISGGVDTSATGDDDGDYEEPSRPRCCFRMPRRVKP